MNSRPPPLFRLAAVAAVFAGGCISAPPPTDSTTPWTPPAGAQKPDNSWKALRAQAPDVSRPLALAELADMALRNNPATRKTWSDARAAAAQVEQVQGYFMPTINGTATVGHQYTSAEPDTYDQDYWKVAPGLQLSYLIFNFGGGRRAAVQQAMQTVYAANFAFNRSIQDVLLAVETAYYGVVSAQAGIVAAEANVKDAKTALEAAQERLNAGMGTQLDVLQTQAAYDQSLYALANVQGLFQIARGRLSQAVGLPADAALQTAAPTNDVPQALATLDMQRLIDEALDRRPDVAALRATAAAKEASVRVAGSPLWPSLYLNSTLSRDYFEVGTGQNLQDRDWSFAAGLSLQWTLFDGFLTRGAQRVAMEQLESTRAEVAQAELAASADVWTRFHSYETALQKYQFSDAYLKSASALYDLALESYKGGLKSILDLLTAENQLAEARRQHVVSQLEAFIALANLAHATGLLEKGGAAQAPGLFSTPTNKDAQP
jgi:outer membrane protein